MSSVSSVEQQTQQNFNPSWMRTNPAANRGGLTGGGRVSGSGGGGNPIYDEGGDDSSTAAANVLSTPIVSEFSYTREELLNLVKLGQTMPAALRDQLFFNENNLPLISNLPPTELEQFQRLQNNINSSKAMSMLSHADRASIAAGAAYGSGYSGGIGTGAPSSLQNGQSPTNRWAPKASWSNTNKPATDRSLGAVPRGGGTAGRAGSTGFFSGRGGGRIGGENGFGGAAANGGGQTAPNSGEESSGGVYQPKFNNVRRGGVAGGVGRGGSTSGATFNTRADALYNPNDPTDRPKTVSTAVTRSESDDEDEEGWKTVKRHPEPASSERPAWVRSESFIQRQQQAAAAQQQQQQQAPISHWNREGDSTVWKDRNQMVASVKKTSIENSTSQPSPQEHHQQQSSAQSAPPEEPETLGNEVQAMPAFAPNASTWSNSVMGGGMSSMGVFYQPPPPPQPQPTAPKEEVLFYYMDPTNTRRGPFAKDQMEMWFKAGYFSDETLRVQRGEGDYKTIGELKATNGVNTPFEYPEDAPPAPRPIMIAPTAPQLSAMPAFSAAANPMFPQQFGGMGMWAQTPEMYTMMQTTFENQMMAERQKLMEEQNRRLAEETKKFQEFQEAMYRQMTMQQELTAREMREKEMALQRHREELERRDAELKQEALARQQKIEAEARELEERKAVLEAEARRKVQMELELRHRAEEQQRVEAAKAAQERIRRAEEAAENERHRLEYEARQAEETLRQLKLRKEQDEREKAEQIRKQIEDRERIAREAAVTAARQQAELEAIWAKKPTTLSTSSSSGVVPKQVSPSGSDDSEGWTVSGKEKEVKHTKAAPWASKVEAAPAEKTLLEIQIEEERQMRAEREQIARMKAKETVANLGSAAPAVPEKKDWGTKTWAAPEVTTAPKSYVSPFLDGPSLEAANKMALQKKNSQPKIVPAKPAPTAPKAPTTPVKAAKPPVVQTASQKKQASQDAAYEALETWFVTRFRQLKSGVDGKTLFECIWPCENPNEVEDIVMSYVEESKSVKEFVREFIKRRIAMRAAAGGRPDVDDLTSARTAQAAPSDSNSNSNSGNGGGKKKKKNTKQVLDGNILGFRGAAASDRLNKGEIDAIPTAPVNPSRR